MKSINTISFGGVDYELRMNVGGIDSSTYFINLSGKKIYLYGDSISSSDYSFYKEELEFLTNAIVYNNGHSGWNASALAQSSPLQSAVNESPDVVFILVGGNDIGLKGSVGTFGTYGGTLNDEPIVNIPSIKEGYLGTTFIEAVAYITQYLTYHIGGFRHKSYNDGICTDVGSSLSSEKILDDIQKPIIVLCTTLPQQRNGESDAWSLNVNSKRKADACREVSQLLNIPLLDLSTRAGFSMINETYWENPTDMVHNKGTYMMDGLHPNKYGYRRMARLCYDFIRPYFTT